MQLDFSNLLNCSADIIDIDYHIDADTLSFGTDSPLKNGADVKGRAYQKVGVVYLEVDIKFDFISVCDRCLDDINRNYNFSLNKIVVQKMENENDDYFDYIVVENNILNLDDLINEEIQLFLPSKFLCKEDCKGLCPKCGTNLNYEKCKCAKDIDPRLAALSDLLIED